MAEQELSKVVTELIKPSWLIALGAGTYAGLTMRLQRRAGEKHGFLDVFIDLLVGGFAGLLFFAGALAAGYSLGWAGFVGGVGGHMGPRGLVVLGDAIIGIAKMLTDKWGAK